MLKGMDSIFNSEKIHTLKFYLLFVGQINTYLSNLLKKMVLSDFLWPFVAFIRQFVVLCKLV